MIQFADDASHESDDDRVDDYLPARMVNEFVYCPRLFYLMHVEGQFAPNRYTVEGSMIHGRVDAKTDAIASPDANRLEAKLKVETGPLQAMLFADTDTPNVDSPLEQSLPIAGAMPLSLIQTAPQPSAAPETLADPPAKPETIHARSVTLASDELRVVAKLDLIEASGVTATPVDYKRGRPRMAEDGTLTAWKPERVQMCLQALVLRENGFDCHEAIIYFQSTRQRVTVPITDELIRLTKRAVAAARSLAEQSTAPPPLVNSPKCPRCSLSPICLPDETNRCRSKGEQNAAPEQPVRLPATPRDDLRPLYLNRQGLFVGKSSEVLQVKDQGKVIEEVRLREINQVNLFGNIQISTQAMQTLLELDVPLVMFSQHGYFHGMLQGTGLKNILLRREQFRFADDPARCLAIAKRLVHGKIKNQRVLLMRNHIAPPKSALIELNRQLRRAEQAANLQTLLGVEGNAARIYFSLFAGMLKPGDTPYDPANVLGEPPKFAFDFRGRNRRPPRDPVNAMLSLCYTLLAKDFTVLAAAVGFDPYLGFFHQVRPGRPALALDLMEPFRALVADSVVLTAVNNRMVYPEHFIPAGRGVTMTESGRKAIFRAYEQRMDQLVTHPLFDYRVSYRRLLDIQTRLLAAVVRGELEEYPVFVSR